MPGIRDATESCQDGRYGSTQSTVLALRAIVAYDRAHARPKAPGSLRVLVDGKVVGVPVPFDRNSQGTLKLPDISEHLPPGKHQKIFVVAPQPGSQVIQLEECGQAIGVPLVALHLVKKAQLSLHQEPAPPG